MRACVNQFIGGILLPGLMSLKGGLSLTLNDANHVYK